MLSFELKEGLPAVRQVLDRLSLFTLAESLGGVESLIDHPATMTHASMATATKEAAGVTGGLLRLSVGLEDGDDLLQDLDQALGV